VLSAVPLTDIEPDDGALILKSQKHRSAVRSMDHCESESVTRNLKGKMSSPAPQHPKQRYALGLYEKAMPYWLSLQEKLKLVRQYGYDFMELSIDESDEKLARLNASAAWFHEIREAIQDTSVTIPTMCLSGHRRYPLGSAEQTMREKGLAIMKAAIRLAAELGVRIIQLAGYDVYYEPSTAQTQALFEENLWRSVEYAARYGVCLAFETMETPFMNTIEKAMRYVSRIASPYLQIYPDIGNLTNAFEGDTSRVVNDMKTGKGHLVALHLKETKPGIFREVPYGEGHVDFAACSKEATCQGVRIFTSEFWFAQASSNWEMDITNAHAFIFQTLEKAFSEEV